MYSSTNEPHTSVWGDLTANAMYEDQPSLPSAHANSQEYSSFLELL
ncbi:hypothetical protein AB9P05_13930 [Roseivirga sp. BDSF3-8]